MRWTRLALILFVLTILGCGKVVTLRPDVTFCPLPRPPMVDEMGRVTEEGRRWLGACLQAGYENCVALTVMRGESQEPCKAPLR